MNFRKNRKEEVGVNLTPLIDVVFLLLIFFMVTTTFTKETHLEIELPTSSSTQTISDQGQIEIIVDSGGNYVVQSKSLVKSDLNTLIRALEEETGNLDNPPIIVVADAKAPHQSVVNVLDAAGKLGLSKLRMATRKDSE